MISVALLLFALGLEFSFKELDIRNMTGVTVAVVMREGRLYPNPSAGFKFEKGDMVGALGTPEQLERFKKDVGQVVNI